MTTKTDPAPTQAQVRQFCRKAVSLWLVQLAAKIDSGEVDGFDLKWAHEAETPRPIGRVIQDAQFVAGPSPDRVEPARVVEPAPRIPSPPTVAGPLSAVRSAIPVEDISAQIRDGLRGCDDPDCPNCKRKA